MKKNKARSVVIGGHPAGLMRLYWIPVATLQLCWTPAATFSLLDSSNYIYTLYCIPVATSQFATHMLLQIPFGAGVEEVSQKILEVF